MSNYLGMASALYLAMAEHEELQKELDEISKRKAKLNDDIKNMQSILEPLIKNSLEISSGTFILNGHNLMYRDDKTGMVCIVPTYQPYNHELYMEGEYVI